MSFEKENNAANIMEKPANRKCIVFFEYIRKNIFLNNIFKYYVKIFIRKILAFKKSSNSIKIQIRIKICNISWLKNQ